MKYVKMIMYKGVCYESSGKVQDRIESDMHALCKDAIHTLNVHHNQMIQPGCSIALTEFMLQNRAFLKEVLNDLDRLEALKKS